MDESMSGILGAKIFGAIQALRQEAFEFQRRADDVESAWRERDFEFLFNAGFLTVREIDELESEEKSHMAAYGMARNVRRPRRSSRPVKRTSRKGR